MPMTPAEESAKRTEIANFLYRGWASAMDEDSPSTTDPRIDSVKRLLPALDPLDNAAPNMAAVLNGLMALPLDKLQAEQERRIAGHRRGTEAWTDESRRQTGRREDVTTTDIARGAGEAFGGAFGGVLSGLWAFLKPILPYAGIAVAGYLIVTNLPKKGSADWRDNR